MAYFRRGIHPACPWHKQLVTFGTKLVRTSFRTAAPHFDLKSSCLLSFVSMSDTNLEDFTVQARERG